MCVRVKCDSSWGYFYSMHLDYYVSVTHMCVYVCLHVQQFPTYQPELTRRVIKFLEAYHSNTPTECANDLLTPLNKETGECD